MTPDAAAILLSRIPFGLTVSFHIIIPAVDAAASTVAAMNVVRALFLRKK